MPTSPTVPEWMTEFVPPDTLKDALSGALTKAEVDKQLAPLISQYKALSELRDDVILMRLTKAGHPVTRDANKAKTTDDGYDIVDETFEAFGDLFPAFEVVRALSEELEGYQSAGLWWRCDSNDDEVVS